VEILSTQSRERAVADEAAASGVGGSVPKGRADHGRMSAAQKTLRDAAIVAALHSGVEVKVVAKRYEITPRAVQSVFRAFRLRPTAVDHRPMEIVERLLRSYEEQMQSFAAVAESTIERQPAVAVAALKGQAESLERYVMVLLHLGKLPRNLELFAAEAQMRRRGEEVGQLLEDVVQGRLSALEAQARYEELLSRALSSRWIDGHETRELEEGNADAA
jgi:hypothetical protein